MEVKKKKVKQESRFVTRGLNTKAKPDKHEGIEVARLDASHLTRQEKCPVSASIVDRGHQGDKHPTVGGVRL